MKVEQIKIIRKTILTPVDLDDEEELEWVEPEWSQPKKDDEREGDERVEDSREEEERERSINTEQEER